MAKLDKNSIKRIWDTFQDDSYKYEVRRAKKDYGKAHEQGDEIKMAALRKKYPNVDFESYLEWLLKRK